MSTRKASKQRRPSSRVVFAEVVADAAELFLQRTPKHGTPAWSASALVVEGIGVVAQRSRSLASGACDVVAEGTCEAVAGTCEVAAEGIGAVVGEMFEILSG